MKQAQKLIQSIRALVLITAGLPVFMAAGQTQAATISYLLDDVFLADGSQMTGAFDWTYDNGDFEGGTGVFTELEIP